MKYTFSKGKKRLNIFFFLSDIPMKHFKIDKSKLGTPGVREAKTLTEKGKKKCNKCSKELQNSQRPDLCAGCEAEKNVPKKKD